jgi:hypothetical protein
MDVQNNRDDISKICLSIFFLVMFAFIFGYLFADPKLPCDEQNIIIKKLETDLKTCAFGSKEFYEKIERIDYYKNKRSCNGK